MRSYDAGEVYATTKLANVLVAGALARRLDGTRVTANALHPGVAGTAVLNALYRKPWWMAPITRRQHPSPDGAAQSIARLAVDQGLATTNGAYFHEFELSEPSEQARDTDLGERFWHVSCGLLGLAPELGRHEDVASALHFPS